MPRRIVGADNAFWGAESGRCPVERVAHASAVEEVADVKQVLRDPQVLLDCNIYSLIFDFANNRLHLASGGTPAAEYRYRSFPLFF